MSGIVRIKDLDTAEELTSGDYLAVDSVGEGLRKVPLKPITDDISDLKSKIDDLEPLSEDVKTTLLACFQKVAWIDEHGQDYYDDLYDALYPDTGLVRITAVFTQGSAVIYPSTPINDLKAYLVVTGYYNDSSTKIITDYSLSGTLEVGTSTITVTKEGKTTTFTVTVSAPYWDYEWYASSRTLPEGMTAFRYNFTDEPGAMFVANPVLDFDYIGNCRMMIECKWSVFYENMDTLEVTAYANGGNNPQLFALNKTINNQLSGSRVIGHADNQSEEGYDLRLLAGQTQQYFGHKDNVYHLFDLLANGNECSVSLPNDDFSVSGTGYVSQYNPYTGIKSVYPPYEDEDTRIRIIYGLYIKSIKFKKL